MLKPRRIGMLGKALRVASGSSQPAPPAPAAEDVGEDEGGDAATRKRKADRVAAGTSPKPPSDVADGKRRHSPLGSCAADPVLSAPPTAARPVPPVPRFDGSSSSNTSRPPLPARQPLAPVSSTAATAPSKPVGAVPPAAVHGRQLQQRVVLHEGSAAKAADSDEETAPVVMSRLAQRVQKGRQSLAPGKIVLLGDSVVAPRGGAAAGADSDDDEDDDDAPTAPVSHAPAADTAAAASEEDVDATRPLSRPPPPSK